MEFQQVLVGNEGQVLDRYASTTKPEAMTDDIEQALASANNQ